MDDRHPVVRNAFYLLSAQSLEKILLFAMAVVLSRYLGVAGFGVYSFSFSFAELFSFFFGFGLYELILREVSQGRGKILPNALTLQLMSSGLGAALACAVIRLMGYPLRTEAALYLALAATAFYYIALSFRAVIVAHERMGYEGGLTVLIRVLALLGFLGCILLKKHILEVIGVMVLVNGAGVFLSASLVLWRLRLVGRVRDLLGQADGETMRWVFREALPFAVLALFVTIYLQIDSVMLSKMKGDEAVGLYSAAYRLVLVLIFVSTSLSLSVLPRISRTYRNGRGEAAGLYRKTAKVLLILALPIAILMTLSAGLIIEGVYGREYRDAARILQVIVWVLPAMFLTNFAGRVLGIIGRQRVTMSVSGVGALVNVVLNGVLIPKYSYLGAALATVLTEFVVLSLQLYYVSRYLLGSLGHRVIGSTSNLEP